MDWNGGESVQGSLARNLFGYFCSGSLLIGPVCLLSQGPFEEPVRR